MVDTYCKLHKDAALCYNYIVFNSLVFVYVERTSLCYTCLLLFCYTMWFIWN